MTKAENRMYQHAYKLEERVLYQRRHRKWALERARESLVAFGGAHGMWKTAWNRAERLGAELTQARERIKELERKPRTITPDMVPDSIADEFRG